MFNIKKLLNNYNYYISIYIIMKNKMIKKLNMNIYKKYRKINDYFLIIYLLLYIILLGFVFYLSYSITLIYLNNTKLNFYDFINFKYSFSEIYYDFLVVDKKLDKLHYILLYIFVIVILIKLIQETKSLFINLINTIKYSYKKIKHNYKFYEKYNNKNDNNNENYKYDDIYDKILLNDDKILLNDDKILLNDDKIYNNEEYNNEKYECDNIYDEILLNDDKIYNNEEYNIILNPNAEEFQPKKENKDIKEDEKEKEEEDEKEKEDEYNIYIIKKPFLSYNMIEYIYDENDIFDKIILNINNKIISL